MNRKSFALLLGLLLFPLLISAVLPFSVSAEADKTLRLLCAEGAVKIENMNWKIYKIGENNGSELILTGQFADVQVDVQNLQEERNGVIAKTLESFVLSDAIAETASGQTDAEGTAEFHALEAGIYLAIPMQTEKNGRIYTASPLLAALSDTDTEILPKIYSTASRDDTDRRIKVRKIWLNETDADSSRPESITVALYQNGKPYKTAVLDSANNWEYEWNLPDLHAEWRVAERDVPKQYTVLVDYQSGQFVIQNICRRNDSPAQTTAPAADKLPQTGQLWWPVPLLAACGIVCMAGGLYLKRKNDE